MITLGLSQDRYESGVCIVRDGRILYAANEERFTRRKNQGGFPRLALEAALRATRIAGAEVDRICVAGLMTPPFPVRAFPSLHERLFGEDRTGVNRRIDRLVECLALSTPLAHTDPSSPLRRATVPLLPHAVRRTLPAELRHAPLRFVEHHQAHAEAAWRLSGFNSALALTADSMGDGLSMTVAHGQHEQLQRLWSVPSRSSLGRFYEIVTEAMGFIPSRHEGKVTGLAAMGDHRAVSEPSPFRLRLGELEFSGDAGRGGVAWVRSLLQSHRREDVCAWAQAILEDVILTVTRTWLRETGASQLVLGGGVFANVKLNQRLHELEEVDEIFVCPNMGDGGLSVGAVCADGAIPRRRIRDVFWGDAFSSSEVETALADAGLGTPRAGDLARGVAERLARGEVVGLFRGRMEWGPRALGNRSVVAGARDPAINERLNRMLKRSDFMPFAPAIRAEDATVYLGNWRSGLRAAGFMTCCFRATERLRSEHPAVVHSDGTVRAQVVDAETNPDLHCLLTACKERSGSGVLLNTSFNRHEEPIVRTPAEAIATFRAAGLDALAIGEFLVRS